MPYLQLTVQCSREQQPHYEQALALAGALSITALDAQAETPDEEAIFEPALGETPLWNTMRLLALYPCASDGLDLLHCLHTSYPQLAWDSLSFQRIQDQEWERAWLEQFQPMRFGEHTYIVPWTHSPPSSALEDENAVVIRLDPGLAFGSGTHATTALCLERLDALATSGLLQNQSLLDFGCGSGILAIAAVKLGASEVTAVDIDPQALVASQSNAERNAVGDKIYISDTTPLTRKKYRFIVANILAKTLDLLAEDLLELLDDGGELTLSGILKGQENDLIARYQPSFGQQISCIYKEGWARLDAIGRIR